MILNRISNKSLILSRFRNTKISLEKTHSKLSEIKSTDLQKIYNEDSSRKINNRQKDRKSIEIFLEEENLRYD